MSAGMMVWFLVASTALLMMSLLLISRVLTACEKAAREIDELNRARDDPYA